MIYARNTSLVLEPPSEKQQEYAKMGEAERNRLTERERRLLEIRQQKHSKKENGEEKPKDDVTADGTLKAEDAATSPANQSMIVKKPNKGLGVADRPSFKRKHVKVILLIACKFQVSSSLAYVTSAILSCLGLHLFSVFDLF